MSPPYNIAVIGSGVAGITAAYLLSRQHNVTIFEKNDYLGGHTHTIPQADQSNVDTGFIVFNNKTYPNFIKFLSQLEVDRQKTDMSFSYYSEASGLQYAGKDLNGLFAQRKNILSPSFWKLIFEIIRFAKEARLFLKSPEANYSPITLGDFITLKRFSEEFKNRYIVPMAAAIWSAPDAQMMEFPLVHFARFFSNHGLLSILNRPTWYVVKGGSFSYVKKFEATFQGNIHLKTAVKKISRSADHVSIRFDNGTHQNFDKVIIATHADQALKLLEIPTEQEKELLGAWGYSSNRTVLHTDVTVLPPLKRAWASWNYLRKIKQEGNSPVKVSYYMNLLQQLKSRTEYVVTLNCESEVLPEKVLGQYDYEHPIFNTAAFKTQETLQSLNGINNTYYCGSYFGYGFHEDAVTSSVNMAKLFGIEL